MKRVGTIGNSKIAQIREIKMPCKIKRSLNSKSCSRSKREQSKTLSIKVYLIDIKYHINYYNLLSTHYFGRINIIINKLISYLWGFGVLGFWG